MSELILLAALLSAGFLVLPALAWLLGSLLLGAQSESIGLGSVYGSVFREAAQGKIAAWLFAATPYGFVQSLRLLLWALRGRGDRRNEAVPADGD